MIGDFFLNIVYWFLSSIIGFLPNSTGFPPVVVQGATYLGGFVGMLDPIVPMATLATVVGIAFTVEIAIFGFKTLRWFMGHIPFIGGNH